MQKQQSLIQINESTTTTPRRLCKGTLWVWGEGDDWTPIGNSKRIYDHSLNQKGSKSIVKEIGGTNCETLMKGKRFILTDLVKLLNTDNAQKLFLELFFDWENVNPIESLQR
jgi:hypothetical protein